MNDTKPTRFNARRATSQVLLLGGSLVAGLTAFWVTPKAAAQATAQTNAQNPAQTTSPQGWDAATNASSDQQAWANTAAPTWSDENDDGWSQQDEYASPHGRGGRGQAWAGQGSLFSGQAQQAPRGWSRGS